MARNALPPPPRTSIGALARIGMHTVYLLKFLAQMALPPASLAVGALVAAALALLGLRRLAQVVLAIAIVQNILLAMPPVAGILMATLQSQSRVESGKAAACCYDAIVVLGGGIGPAMPPHIPDPHLNDSADRIWHAARLYHRGAAPRIIASGGGGKDMTEAEAMRIFLIDLGVPAEAIVMEDASLNTIETIRLVRDLVKDARIALVTSASHMPRAMRLARIAGLNASAFPTDWALPGEDEFAWYNFVPTATALSISSVALVEIMANAFDRRGNSLAQ